MVLDGLYCCDAYRSLVKTVSTLLILIAVAKRLDKSSSREERFMLDYSSSGYAHQGLEAMERSKRLAGHNVSKSEGETGSRGR